MQKKIYTIPILGGEKEQDDMNAFLRGQKVLGVEQCMVEQSGIKYWSFCITYLPQAGSANAPFVRTESVDYKKQLTDEQFKIFSQLREIRKQLAQNDAVPAYSVFTDKELAEIAKLAETNSLTESTMKKIDGISDKRVAKYGKLIIEEYTKLCTEPIDSLFK